MHFRTLNTRQLFIHHYMIIYWLLFQDGSWNHQDRQCARHKRGKWTDFPSTKCFAFGFLVCCSQSKWVSSKYWTTEQVDKYRNINTIKNCQNFCGLWTGEENGIVYIKKDVMLHLTIYQDKYRELQRAAAFLIAQFLFVKCWIKQSAVRIYKQAKSVWPAH